MRLALTNFVQHVVDPGVVCWFLLAFITATNCEHTAKLRSVAHITVLWGRQVKRNEVQYQIPLTILSYKELYGWSMDEIVKEIGTKNNCTFCGVFRRQALDRGAALMNANKVATGVLPAPVVPLEDLASSTETGSISNHGVQEVHHLSLVSSAAGFFQADRPRLPGRLVSRAVESRVV